jgi:hypothetical protein
MFWINCQEIVHRKIIGIIQGNILSAIIGAKNQQNSSNHQPQNSPKSTNQSPISTKHANGKSAHNNRNSSKEPPSDY